MPRATSKGGEGWNGWNVLNGHVSLRVRLGVLAGELRGLSFQPLFLALQARLPCPRALEIVADLHAQPAQRLGFQLDEVAVLKGVQAAVIGSQRQHVAWLERMD